jgi:hypothetical protein
MYSVEALGGETATRSDPPAPAVYEKPSGEVLMLSPRSSLRITLRPSTAVDQAVEMRAFLAREGRTERWRPPLEINGQNGIFMISGSRDALFPGLVAGEIELIFAVGRAGALPEDEAIASAGATGPSAGDKEAPYRIQRIRARLLGDKAESEGR